MEIFLDRCGDPPQVGLDVTTKPRPSPRRFLLGMLCFFFSFSEWAAVTTVT